MDKKHGITMILLLLCFTMACSNDDDTMYIPDVLDTTWFHSYEEDTEQYDVYRPASYDFPPARFRYSFQLQRSGSAWESTPGPADVPLTIAGQWQYIEDDNSFILSLENDITRTLNLVEYQSDLLKLIVQ